MPSTAAGHIAAVRPAVLDFVADLARPGEPPGRWPYHRYMVRPYALISTAQVLELVLDLDAADCLGDGALSAAIAWLRDCQDPTDGVFKDPLVGEAQREGTHTWEQIHGQMAIAGRCLARMGIAPLHPEPPARFADLGSTDPEAFTAGLDWSNPWRHGESWARAIGAHLASAGSAGRAAALRRLEPAFRHYEREIVSPDSGFPDRAMEQPDDSRALAGLFKTMKAYLDAGRPVPHAAAAIDRTLALQHADGEFGYRGNMCINWDALWVLRQLDRQLAEGHRHREIVAAGGVLAERLVTHYLQSDGGFAFHGDRCISNHHSIHLSPAGHPVGDTIGTWMCLRCLAYSDAWRTGGKT